MCACAVACITNLYNLRTVPVREPLAREPLLVDVGAGGRRRVLVDNHLALRATLRARAPRARITGTMRFPSAAAERRALNEGRKLLCRELWGFDMVHACSTVESPPPPSSGGTRGDGSPLSGAFHGLIGNGSAAAAGRGTAMRGGAFLTGALVVNASRLPSLGFACCCCRRRSASRASSRFRRRAHIPLSVEAASESSSNMSVHEVRRGPPATPCGGGRSSEAAAAEARGSAPPPHTPPARSCR